MKKYYNIPQTEISHVQGMYVMSDTSNPFEIKDEDPGEKPW